MELFTGVYLLKVSPAFVQDMQLPRILLGSSCNFFTNLIEYQVFVT